MNIRENYILPGIGRFSLRVESVGVDEPKQFKLRRHITRIIWGFLPSGRRVQGRRISYAFSEDVEVAWEK